MKAKTINRKGPKGQKKGQQKGKNMAKGRNEVNICVLRMAWGDLW